MKNNHEKPLGDLVEWLALIVSTAPDAGWTVEARLAAYERQRVEVASIASALAGRIADILRPINGPL